MIVTCAKCVSDSWFYDKGKCVLFSITIGKLYNIDMMSIRLRWNITSPWISISSVRLLNDDQDYFWVPPCLFYFYYLTHKGHFERVLTCYRSTDNKEFALHYNFPV